MRTIGEREWNEAIREAIAIEQRESALRDTQDYLLIQFGQTIDWDED